jgi:adenylate cyclase
MEHRGTVDKYIGDAIMAFWNAPAPVENHAVLACQSALACQEALLWLREDPANTGASRPRSLFQANTRMGIHTGEVIVGNMGSPERLNYTAIGDSVNVASRLEGMNKNYKTSIIISETTRAATAGAVSTRLLDKIAVKGRKSGIRIYELLDPRVFPEGNEFAGLATEAVEKYLRGDFDQALSLIEEAARIRSEDPALSIIKKRCEAFKVTRPPPDWDGVYIYHEK